ncbi:BNR-4 repeat-containing protein [Leifsonia sp. NPDC056824]|uniref:BNR-4 repeat-containing protein n=1 Tax=Leifsonia sp. NPDC056824 TaxID=3345953 RepID=UPI0036CBAF4C
MSTDERYLVGVRTAGVDDVALFARPVGAPQESNLVKAADRTVALPIVDRLVGGHAALYSHYSTAAFSNAKVATTSDKPAAITDGFDRADSTDIRSSWHEGVWGDWSVRDGAMEANAAGVPEGRSLLAIQQHVDLSGGAFRVRADLEVGTKLSGTWRGTVVNLRDRGVEGRQQYYALRFRDSTNEWQFMRSDSSRVPNEVALKRGSLSLDKPGNYTLEIVSSAPGRFRVSISKDGSPVLAPNEIVDDTPIAGGAVALMSIASAATPIVRFDDFSVVSSHSDGAPLVIATSCVGLTLGHNTVGQSVLTRGDRQYVAYYGTDRYLRVASRSLAGSESTAPCVDGDSDPAWTTQELDTRVPDDAHNSVTMAFDSDGQLHVIGNLHAGSLDGSDLAEEYRVWARGGAYYRTTTAGDVRSLSRVTGLAPRVQDRYLTYPSFITVPGTGAGADTLMITYRIGWSGGGTRAFDRYDPATKTWKVHSTFTDYGDSPRETGPHQGDIDDVYNMYPSQIVRGTDGVFRMAWVWRNNADVRTTSRVSYAESADLVTWKTIAGAKISTPVKYDDTTAGLVVDDVPEGVPGQADGDNGLVSVALQLDGKNNPVLFYTKLDERSDLQLYTAHLDARTKSWEPRPLTTDTGVEPVSGVGTMSLNSQIGTTAAYGTSHPTWIVADYSHGSRNNHVIVDSRSGLAVADSPGVSRVAPMEDGPSHHGLWFIGSRDLGGATSSGRNWSLQWFTMPDNGDRIVTPAGVIAGAEPSLTSLNPQPLWVYTTQR